MTSEVDYQCNNCGHEGINTRAVPDVPELVRYTVRLDRSHYEGMVVTSAGAYVRYDQAAKIIAAKDEEIERLKETLQEIANSYTAHGYNDAVDAVVNLQYIAKDCLNAKR